MHRRAMKTFAHLPAGCVPDIQAAHNLSARGVDITALWRPSLFPSFPLLTTIMCKEA